MHNPLGLEGFLFCLIFISLFKFFLLAIFLLFCVSSLDFVHLILVFSFIYTPIFTILFCTVLISVETAVNFPFSYCYFICIFSPLHQSCHGFAFLIYYFITISYLFKILLFLFLPFILGLQNHCRW